MYVDYTSNSANMLALNPDHRQFLSFWISFRHYSKKNLAMNLLYIINPNIPVNLALIPDH